MAIRQRICLLEELEILYSAGGFQQCTDWTIDL